MKSTSMFNSRTINLRIINPTLHGVADYTAAIGLIIAPFILDLGQTSIIALWFSVCAGIVVLLTSLLTDYNLGAIKVIPLLGHLAMDLVFALTFMIIPFIWGFAGMDVIYYWFNAVMIVLVVSLSSHN